MAGYVPTGDRQGAMDLKNLASNLNSGFMPRVGTHRFCLAGQMEQTR